MKSFFLKAIGVLTLVGTLLGTPAFAAGLPVASWKPLKLPAYVTKTGVIGYIVPLTGAHVEGVIASIDGLTLIVTDEEGTDYTVDIEQAVVMNRVGKKVKRDVLDVGNVVAVDGYLARNSTGMSARRIINAGPVEKKIVSE